MPRVGSSRISSRGSVISQRASSTFCWLPPLRLRTGISGSAGRMLSALMYLSTSSSWRRRGIGRGQPRAACSARMMFSRTRQVARPGPRSGGSPSRTRCRAPIAARGLRSVTGLPSIATWPWSARSAPNSSRASSVRPGAEQPGQADDLAAVDGEAERRDRALAARARSASTTGVPLSTAAERPLGLLLELLQRRRAPCRSSSRPARAAAARAVGYSPTSRPLRRTVIRSEIS